MARKSPRLLTLAVSAALGTLALFVAACSSGNKTVPPPLALPTPTPTPSPSPTPTIVPAAVATSIAVTTTSLAPGSTAPPIAIPAPTGYAQTVSLPISSAAANTTIQVTNSVAPPAKIPPLSASRSALSLRFTASDSFQAIFYTIALPSSNVVLGGAASQTILFPNGALNASTSYYLAFYDSTVANPQWNTIAGPVTPTGSTLVFSGTIPTYTLLANNYYGVAVFSIAQPGATPPPAPVINTSPSPTPSPSPAPSVSPTATPTPTASPSTTPSPFPTAAAGVTTGFGAGSAAGLEVFTATSVLGTINYPYTVDGIALDDSGNMYMMSNAQIPSPGASPTNLSSGVVKKYAFESTTPTATYTASGPLLSLISVSGAGRLVVESFDSAQINTEYFDVWESGKTGAPSFTITIPTANQTCPTFTLPFMTHDGTLIVPEKNGTSGVETYEFYPNGSQTPSGITESYVSQMNQCYFDPNYMAVGPDGTLYVTEYGYYDDDPLAGLYVIPPAGTGSETYVVTPSDPSNLAQMGPAPGAVDVDGAGNVYVTNNNSVYSATGSGGYTPDTLHTVAVYTPHGAQLTRTISNGLGAPQVIVADTDGTAFIGDWAAGNGNALPNEANGAIHVLAPGASSVTTLGTLTLPLDIALYNGTTARNILTVGGRSGGAHGGGVHGAAARRVLMSLRRR